MKEGERRWRRRKGRGGEDEGRVMIRNGELHRWNRRRRLGGRGEGAEGGEREGGVSIERVVAKGGKRGEKLCRAEEIFFHRWRESGRERETMAANHGPPGHPPLKIYKNRQIYFLVKKNHLLMILTPIKFSEFFKKFIKSR